VRCAPTGIFYFWVIKLIEVDIIGWGFMFSTFVWPSFAFLPRPSFFNQETAPAVQTNGNRALFKPGTLFTYRDNHLGH
jgi:hypothetical protein